MCGAQRFSTPLTPSSMLTSRNSEVDVEKQVRKEVCQFPAACCALLQGSNCLLLPVRFVLSCFLACLPHLAGTAGPPPPPPRPYRFCRFRRW